MTDRRPASLPEAIAAKYLAEAREIHERADRLEAAMRGRRDATMASLEEAVNARIAAQEAAPRDPLASYRAPSDADRTRVARVEAARERDPQGFAAGRYGDPMQHAIALRLTKAHPKRTEDPTA